MKKIPFNVSARTARLIGRENVSNATSAIIELVKNSYDADANISIVLFDIKYTQVPKTISKTEYKDLSGIESIKNIIEEHYKELKSGYVLAESIDKQDYDLFRKAKALTDVMLTPILFELRGDIWERRLANVENHAKQVLSKLDS